VVYYLEVNSIAILVACILFAYGRVDTSRRETLQRIYNFLLLDLVFLCLSDILAYYFRGKNYWGIQISNMVFFLTLAYSAFLWFILIGVKLGTMENLKKNVLVSCAPMVLTSAMILLNPLTGFVFTVDENLLYHRGLGVVITWIVEWGYQIASIVIAAGQIRKEKRAYRRREYQGYLIFALPGMAASVLQMFFYGTTLVQIGFMTTLLLAFLNKQHYRIQRDGMTELSNQNALLHFKDGLVLNGMENDLTVLYIDVDDFKSINESLGYLEGDRVLTNIAEVLRDASLCRPNQFFAFRYAADDFIVLGVDLKEGDREVFLRNTAEGLKEKNRKNREDKKPYQFSLSIGISVGVCKDGPTFDRLTEYAREDMRRRKKSKNKVN